MPAAETWSFPKSKIKILLLENIHSVAEKMLKDEGFAVKTVSKALSESELIEQASDVHVLGIRSKTQITQKFLKRADKLMTLGCFCIGTNQVDLASARTQGVPVFNAPFSNTRSVAELIMAEIVMLARRAGDKSMKAHQGEWDKSAEGCHEVRGRVLGIVGYGHIGSQVSVLAESFGMRVIFFDIITKMPLGNARAVKSLNDLLSEADFVTFHVPETPDTQGMMGSAQFKKVKKGSYLLNASRGSVVDLEALSAHIKSGHLSGAAIDVFPEEPESNKQKFRTGLQNLPNVILTPHIGGSTEEAQYNIGIEVATSLAKFINTGATGGAVNFPQVDLPVQRGAHRVLNVHKNVPGVLKDINGIISDLGANIQGQFLATDSEIGYLIMDLEQRGDVADEVKERIKNLKTSIRTRILY